MKAKIYDLAGKAAGEVELPSQFFEELREDLIQRAVLSQQSKSRQKYGSFPEAGKQHSADVSRRRRKYRGSYGKGISRVSRKVLWRRGTQFHWVGANTPNVVGGRRAHPPKTEKIWEEKINKKEKRKAIRSAISATINSEIVKSRGHKVPDSYPIILDQSFEKLAKTSDVVKALKSLKLDTELDRCSEKKIRAGKGTMRNRKYRRKVGPLIVVESPCELKKACKNIPGIDIINVDSLNAEMLAPGSNPGRLTLWSKSAIEKLSKDRLYV